MTEFIENIRKGEYPNGLTKEEAKENSIRFGKNILPEKEKDTLVWLFVKQFKSPFIYILIFVGCLSLVSKEYTDALVIFGVLVINAIVGMYQERRASNAVAALKKLSQPKTKVIRDGLLKSIHTVDVTVGDVVYLEAGDVVPADGILLSRDYISVNESTVNGESLPVSKGEGNDMLYKSTIVTSGRGFLKIQKIGQYTLVGELAADLNTNTDKQFELQKKMSYFSVRLLGILALSATFFLLVALYRELPIIATLKTIAALSVAVIPEGLPIVITVVLSIGALHISRARAVLRNLPSGSTLASVSVICTDKTGTLTYGDVSVKEVVDLGKGSFSEEERAMFLYHSLDIKNIAGKKSGDILDMVLDEYLQDTFSLKETKELPFSSENKYNAKEYVYGDHFLQIYKGAGEVFHVNTSLLESYAKKGFRVLFVGCKLTSKQEEFSTTAVQPLALVVFEDKIREGVRESISRCKKTGISIMMMTGDSILTAKYVATEVGIITSDNDMCFVGSDIEEMNDMELMEKLPHIKVIARVSPSHKERVVSLLQQKGEIVAMTGDGVNDGPALSLANIGIAMGKSGTDVAREASDLVLLQDDFSDIVLAIFEARTIAENIRKALVFLMTSAVGILVLILGSVVTGGVSPLLPVQILWLNFVTAGFLDVAIATEEPEKKYATYTFKRYQQGLLNKQDVMRIIISGGVLGVVTLAIVLLLQNSVQIEVMRTAVIIAFSFGIWVHALNVRKNEDTLGSYSLFSNKYIIFAIAIEAVLLMGSVFTPVGNMLLHTHPISLPLVLLLFVAGSSVLFSDYFFKKYVHYKHERKHSIN